jgi:carboxypeptidase Taq
MTTDFEKLKEKLIEIGHIQSVLAMLDWDMSVNMPEGSASGRGATLGYLTGLAHEKFTNKDFAKLISKLNKNISKLNIAQSAVVREVYRDFEKQKKLPKEFLEELTQTTTNAHGAWVEARRKSNFKIFLPHLIKIVALKRREAKYLGYKNTPYDALLDNFEPGLTSAEVSIVFEELKRFLIPFLHQIGKSKVTINSKVIEGQFPIAKQKEFNQKIIEKFGFDMNTGRVDISAHPFATSFHPKDVRITTRYNEKNLLDSLTGSMHEAGHGIYEQGLPMEHFGTPLASAISLAIHESQSRLWENLIGRGKYLWKYFYPILQKEFPQPFCKVNFDAFYKVLNKVEPSLIRVEADEVTYNLHIIIRFEIEKELIEGTIDPKDLPKIWNDKYKSYFGIKVPNDALGVLQDVHWSAGLFGYFPTYTLGNIYSAQWFAKFKSEHKDAEKQFEKGNFSVLKKWLNEKIHQHGKLYTADKLVQKVTGEVLNINHYLKYLQEKYSDIYKLK